MPTPGQLVLSAFLTCLAFAATAQEQLGLRSSNYGGINAVLLNPAGHLTSPYAFDINVLELAQHTTTNYFYFERTGLLDLAARGPGLSFYSAADRENTEGPGPDDIVLDFNDDGRGRYGFNLSSILGPSFYTALGEHHVVGLITRLRMVGSATSIPEAFSLYTWREQPIDQPFGASPFRSTVLSLGELGLNYLYRREQRYGWIGFGATLKVSFGLEAAFAESPGQLELTKVRPNPNIPDRVDLVTGPLALDLGFTTTAMQGEPYRPAINGGGLGLDLGVQVAIDGPGGGGYAWRLGAALLDLGWVQFRRNAAVHGAQTSTPKTLTTAITTNLKSLADVEESVRELSRQLYDGDPEATYRGSSFSLALPAALSLQADHHLIDRVYVGAVLVQPLPLSSTAPRRSAVLALTPRLEQTWWGAGMTLMLEHWREPHLGASLRIGPLWLGTDAIDSFWRNDRFDSADFYLALKVNPFFTAGGRSRASKRGVRCYQF